MLQRLSKWRNYRGGSGGTWIATVCSAGWEDVSTMCKRWFDDCRNHRCQNGASCRDGRRSYTCLCPVGYTGNAKVTTTIWLRFRAVLFPFDATGLSATRVFLVSVPRIFAQWGGEITH